MRFTKAKQMLMYAGTRARAENPKPGFSGKCLCFKREISCVHSEHISCKVLASILALCRKCVQSVYENVKKKFEREFFVYRSLYIYNVYIQIQYIYNAFQKRILVR